MEAAGAEGQLGLKRSLHYGTLKRIASKSQIITSIGQDVEKSKYSCTVDRNIKWFSFSEKQSGSSSND